MLTHMGQGKIVRTSYNKSPEYWYWRCPDIASCEQKRGACEVCDKKEKQVTFWLPDRLKGCFVVLDEVEL